jgi:enamine deaminase RidA (YjgF/YER057c/UK114 family)
MSRIQSFKRQQAGYSDIFLTGTPAEGEDQIAAARAVYRGLAENLTSGLVQVFQEKLYGPMDLREALLAERAAEFTRAGLDPSLPVLFVDGYPGANDVFAGVQVWGVQPDPGSSVAVTPAASASGVQGRELRADGLRMLHLCGIDGLGDEGSAERGVAVEADAMLSAVDGALKDNNLAFPQVVRTWIYIRRILDWYGEFNRVRTSFFSERGITGGQDGRPFPASTGIRGSCRGEECVVDVLAVEREGEDSPPFERIHQTRRQDTPFAYGSSFSRGMALTRGESRTIFVSGTASIDSMGNTLHIAQPEHQALETLMGVASLLEGSGAALSDVVLATVFYKNQEALEAFLRVTRLLGVTEIPFVAVRADVCRPELLLEIEALAVVDRAPAAAVKKHGSDCTEGRSS